MSYEFTMVLNRQVTDDEAEVLRTSGCGDATFTTATMGVEKDQVATQMDFQTDAPSLAEAITAALEAVKAVPDLTTTSLTVPPYGGNPPPSEEAAPPDGKVIQGQAETVSTESDTASAENPVAAAQAGAVPGEVDAALADGQQS